MPRARLLARALVVPVAATAAGLGPGVAHAAPATCTFESGTVVVTMENENATLSRDPDGTIKLSRDDVDAVTCGSVPATVVTASTVTVGGSGGTLRLDLSNGGFVPGADREPDWRSELEVVWTASDVALEILGSNSSTGDIVAGVADGGYDLNADAERDLVFDTQPVSVTIRGRQGNDYLTGGDGPEVILGGEGDDVVDGAGGDDLLSGDEGTDTASFRSAPAGVVASLEDGRAIGDGTDDLLAFEDLRGSAFHDRLVGSSGPNVVTPGPGDDVVDARGGDDRLVADADIDGADTWAGGDGIDTADYLWRGYGLVISIDDQPNDGAASGEGDNVRLDVEEVYGGRGDDVLVGGPEANAFGGAMGSDLLLGRGGADTLQGGDGNDDLYGGAGNDTLDGGFAADFVDGGDGDDRLHGGDGYDYLDGGPGDDDEFGEGGNDTFLQGETTSRNGSDLLVGGAHVDRVVYTGRAAGVHVTLNGQYDDGEWHEHDNAVVEVVVGTAHADWLLGSAAADRLVGDGGNDAIGGFGGNDVLDGGAGNDVFHEGRGGGKDTFYGGTGVDTVSYGGRVAPVRVDLDNVADDGATGEGDNARSDIENLSGGEGADVLTGSSARNRLAGGGGDDTVSGGGGDDTLYGDSGRDALHGGPGNDTLYARDSIRDTAAGGTGTDRARRDAVDAVSAVESFF